MTANILLTGATRGIGAATFAALKAAGARVVGAGSADGDLADPAVPAKLWARALDLLGGRIDVLINNAAVYAPLPIDDEEDRWQAGWRRAMEINLDAPAALARLAVNHWLGMRIPGRLVNVASRAGHRGDTAEHWYYGTAKGGLLALTKTVARAYADRGILAFAASPGLTLTDMATPDLADGGVAAIAQIPLGRLSTPAEVAEVIRWLALDAPEALTGATLDINGASYVR